MTVCAPDSSLTSRASTDHLVRVGIDTYSYHRYFGEIRIGETDPAIRWTTADFLDRAVALGVDGVSLETCFLQIANEADWARFGEQLDATGLERVLAWGHPDGLRLGLEPSRLQDLLTVLDHSVSVRSPLVRIVVGTYAQWRHEPVTASIERLAPMVAEAAQHAADRGIDLAIETHCALPTAALLELIDRTGADNLGIVLDTANVIRIGEDLVDVATELAPLIRMLHVKDVDLSEAEVGRPGGWWPSVELGSGDLDLEGTLEAVVTGGFDGLACVEIASLPAGSNEDDLVAHDVAWLQRVAASF